MEVFSQLAQLREEAGPIVLAAGFFDGVHTGHQKVIGATIDRAEELGGKAWVLTFDPHPLKVLNPEAAPLLLTANRHKLMLLQRTRLHGCLMLPFTRELANCEPRDFLRSLRANVPALAEIMVGQNWRFGHHGKGTPGLVKRMGRDLGIKLDVVRPVMRKSETVSSTRIRAEILRGNLDEAAAMLGRPVSILGTVVKGRSIGRKIGFPTANLDPHNEVLPPHGVYAVHAVLDGRVFGGVMNFGLRPTFTDGDDIPTLELHLFDFHGDLYGRDIEVFFADFLREEESFPSMELIKKQIGRDAANAHKVLRGKKLKEYLYMPCLGILYSSPDKRKR